MNIINILAGPVIGSIIGYGTNYIAVKMLFRPLKPVQIGKHTLPFTPGIIPKGKDRLAGALGKAVGETLLTKQDIADVLLTEDMKNNFADSIIQKIYTDEQCTIENISMDILGDQITTQASEQLNQIITGKVQNALVNSDIGNIIVGECKTTVQEKVQGTMMAMFVNEDLINSIAEPMGIKINQYIEDHGENLIQPVVERESSEIKQKPLYKILDEDFGVSQEQVKDSLIKMYEKVVSKKAAEFAEKLNIAGIVESKVHDMDVQDLEKLVLSVMKKELNAIVNLGALIGFVIGFINLLF